MVSEHNEKSVFGKALIITAVLFLVGVSLGMFLESQRTDLIGKQYDELQFEVLDSKLRSDFYQLIEEDFCEIAVEDNLRFSDRIYEDGKKIDIYDRFNRLGNGLDDEKRKYALLKTEFWLNSILLKDRCNADYDTVVYFYLDDASDDDVEQSQNVQSNILSSLKEKYGADIMLIPLPVDMGISVIDSFVKLKEISEYPTILINEEIKLEGLHSYEDIEKLI